MDTVGEGEGVTNWETGTDIYTLPRVKHTASGKLLYSTGSSAPCSMMTLRDVMGDWKGGLKGRGYMYTYS